MVTHPGIGAGSEGLNYGIHHELTVSCDTFPITLITTEDVQHLHHATPRQAETTTNVEGGCISLSQKTSSTL